MLAPRAIYLPAFAKINLTLEVLGKRDDGYHSLASVMQTVELHDSLCLRPQRTGSISCTCDIPELATPDNLALRAAYLVSSVVPEDLGGLRVELQKNIPFQAGLGGGSSDAAAVIVALNRLWRSNLTIDRMQELGALLGSDVPFFVRGGTAQVAGRGERVTPLPDAEPLWLILAKPDIGVSTATVFRGLLDDMYGTGEHTAAVVTAIKQGRPLPFEHLVNTLEETVMQAYPQIADIRSSLLRAGAPFVRMSGSGPTLYVPFHDLSAAASVFREIQGLGIQAWLTHTVTAKTVRMAYAMAGEARAGGEG